MFEMVRDDDGTRALRTRCQETKRRGVLRCDTVILVWRLLHWNHNVDDATHRQCLCGIALTHVFKSNFCSTYFGPVRGPSLWASAAVTLRKLRAKTQTAQPVRRRADMYSYHCFLLKSYKGLLYIILITSPSKISYTLTNDVYLTLFAIGYVPSSQCRFHLVRHIDIKYSKI